MANVGIEFTMKDGSKESFDPVNYPDDFLETVTSYHVEISNGYKYSLNKYEVQSFRTYDLCPGCGYEFEGGMCENSNCKNYIEA